MQRAADGGEGKRPVPIIGPAPSPMTIAYLSLFAAIGLAVKQIAYPLALIVSAPFFLPVAPLVSGAYMMWLVTGRAITGYRWAGTFIGAVQAFVALLMVFGRHGAFNLPLYMLTGLSVDIVFLLANSRSGSLLVCLTANCLASLVGTGLVVWVELRMPMLVIAASALVSMASGLLGGWAAHRMVSFYKGVVGKRYNLDWERPRTNASGRSRVHTKISKEGEHGR